MHGREGSGGSVIIVRVTQTAFSGSSGLEEGGGGGEESLLECRLLLLGGILSNRPFTS